MDSNPWIALFDQDLPWSQQPVDLQNTDASLWYQQRQQQSVSVENESSKGDSLNGAEKPPSSQKRAKDTECNSSGAVAKACREKMRRDRLNDRFVELSAILEPDKPPKKDKASVLRDAARILSQLRVETEHLKDENHELQECIRELKAEKNELRNEKLKLKLEKERLVKHIKSATVIPSYMSHPSTVHAAGAAAIAVAAAFPSPNDDPHSSKLSPFAEVPFTMSQWIPQSMVDISNDHVLRPPVA